MINAAKETSNHRIHVKNMSLVDFMELSIGDLIISPTGNMFIMGDAELIDEIVPTGEYEDTGVDIREFEFEDAADSKRKVVFVDSMAIGYDVIIVNGKYPTDTTGIDPSDNDGDDDFGQFIEHELGNAIDPYDFIGD